MVDDELCGRALSGDQAAVAEVERAWLKLKQRLEAELAAVEKTEADRSNPRAGAGRVEFARVRRQQFLTPSRH